MYIPFKWPYKWVAWALTPYKGNYTPMRITAGGPPCIDDENESFAEKLDQLFQVLKKYQEKYRPEILVAGIISKHLIIVRNTPAAPTVQGI